jgi:hypothetical protein
LLFALAQVDREALREEILDPLATYDDGDLSDLLTDSASDEQGR